MGELLDCHLKCTKLITKSENKCLSIGIDRKFDKNAQKIILKTTLMIFNFSKKQPLRMSFQCCLVFRTIAGTIDNCFNNFRHFVKYPNSPTSYSCFNGLQ